MNVIVDLFVIKKVSYKNQTYWLKVQQSESESSYSSFLKAGKD